MYLNDIVLCILFQSNVITNSVFHAVFIYCKYIVYNYSDIFIHCSSHLTLGVVEKAIYEAKSVKQSDSEYKTLFYVKFIEFE